MNVNSGYLGMWHTTQKLTLLISLFLLETILSGVGGQGNAHKPHCLSKFMDPAMRYF